MPEVEVERISIAREFSPYPAGRKKGDGPFTGELFREKHLLPYLRRNARVVLDLDGVEGLPSSFLEEIFGGLVRNGYRLEDLQKSIEFQTTDPLLRMYPEIAWRFAREAQQAA